MSQENEAENAVELAAHIQDIKTMNRTELREKYHGEYNSWKNMKSRCKDYGIELGKKFEDFASFLEIMGPKGQPENSIDRIKPDGPYLPENCRWADKKKQSSNRTNVRLESLGGQQVTVADLADLTGTPASTLYKRRTRGKKPVFHEMLGFDPLRPWPQGRECGWEDLFRKAHLIDENPIEFYHRYSRMQLQAVFERYLDGDANPHAAEALPKGVRAEFLKLQAHWAQRVDDATAKFFAYTDLMKDIERGKLASEAREGMKKQLSDRHVEDVRAMREQLGL